MRKRWFRWLWHAIKPVLLEWLEQRALRLPQHDRDEMAKRLRLDPRVIEQVEEHLRDAVLQALDKWEP